MMPGLVASVVGDRTGASMAYGWGKGQCRLAASSPAPPREGIFRGRSLSEGAETIALEAAINGDFLCPVHCSALQSAHQPCPLHREIVHERTHASASGPCRS